MNGLIAQFSREFRRLLHEFHVPLENPILTFSILLLIILLSPILLRRLKIPSLIGLIMAGVLIGPNGFQLISEANVKTGYVNMFAKIGLLYIMFMAGLELNMQEFKKYRNKSITFGALTFFIPLLLGYPICHYLIGLGETANILTASMFATHTLVAYPIVSKFGISKSEAVAITIGGTILTDTAVLLILAVISGSDKGHINTSILIHLAITLSIFCTILFWGVPRVSRWFFRKLESEKASQFIYVLSVLFFAAFLAEVAGIEAIIGAFVAGLVMNRLIPHSSVLMNRVEFIGNALFIPFFLISIGMLVNARVLAHDPWAWAIAGMLTSFAIFSKFLAALLTQLIFKLTGTERKIIFGLSTAHAAATLAVINVGYEMGIIGIPVVNGTIILILITSLTASIVTENAGKKLLIEIHKDEPLEGPSMRSQHVLVAAYELRGNETLLDFSVLITDKKVSNPISVVSVLENDEEAEMRIRRSRKHMEDFISHYSSGEITVQAMATIDHNIASGIARVSKELAADIVLLNDNANTNFLNRLVGDTRDNLLNSCDKTIFFCHFNHSFTHYRRIKVVCAPYAELEPDCNQWLERIMRLTGQLNCDLDVFSTRDTFEKFKAYRTTQNFSADLTHFRIETPEEALPAIEQSENRHLIFYVLARPGSVSAFNGMESFSSSLEKAGEQKDFVLIYPSIGHTTPSYSAYEDMGSTPFNSGMETLQKIGKEVGGIFKKADEE